MGRAGTFPKVDVTIIVGGDIIFLVDPNDGWVEEVGLDLSITSEPDLPVITEEFFVVLLKGLLEDQLVILGLFL